MNPYDEEAVRIWNRIDSAKKIWADLIAKSKTYDDEKSMKECMEYHIGGLIKEYGRYITDSIKWQAQQAVKRASETS